MDWPRAGTHYPRSAGEFQAWFRTDADCLDYLDWMRWPGGFTCPSCGSAGGWRLGDGRYECGACKRRTSVTAGTLFDRTRTPLTVQLPIPLRLSEYPKQFYLWLAPLGAPPLTIYQDEGYGRSRRWAGCLSRCQPALPTVRGPLHSNACPPDPGLDADLA